MISSLKSLVRKMQSLTCTALHCEIWKERCQSALGRLTSGREHNFQNRREKAARRKKSNIQQGSEERTFRGECKHDRDDSEGEKQVYGSKSLTAAGGFWVITQDLCGFLCSHSEEQFLWFAHHNYSASCTVIKSDAISRPPGKFW